MSRIRPEPRHRSAKSVNVIVGLCVALSAIALIVFVLVLAGEAYPALLLPGFAIAFLIIGWLTYAHLHYRQARQQELLHVLATTVDANLPLAPALRAFIRDRPRGSLYRTLVASIQHVFVFPGYYWIWHKSRSFDDRIESLADHLEEGDSLSTGLRRVPTLANQEVRVAAIVGEATGQLAQCLRRADRERHAGTWLEVAPRLIYPLVLLLVIFCIISYQMVNVIPKFKKIFEDFHQRLPTSTHRLIECWVLMFDHLALMILCVLAAGATIVMLIVSPTVRWYFPIVGRFYRWELQGTLLRMLGTLLATGKTVSEALGLLAGSTLGSKSEPFQLGSSELGFASRFFIGKSLHRLIRMLESLVTTRRKVFQSLDFRSDSNDLPNVARRRLIIAKLATERGEPLAVALHSAGLVPRSMMPLLQTAERIGTLPWTLGELGDLLYRRGIGLAQRISLIVAPILVVAVGVLVGVIVLGFFTPLIQLLDELSKWEYGK